jgi:hypothetical protein
MSKNYYHICVKYETYKLFKECLIEYIKHHPELEHIHISDDKMIYEIVKYYLP